MEKILKIINTMRKNKDLDLLTELNYNMELRKDFDFDSLDLAEFTVRIEKEFDIDVFEDGIVETIGEIIDKIEKKK